MPARGGRVRLSPPDAQAWLRALNDVRLALGVRLGVTDVSSVRIGRRIEIEFAGEPDLDTAREIADSAFHAPSEFLGRSNNSIFVHDAPPRGSAEVTDQTRRSSITLYRMSPPSTTRVWPMM